jgi:hypothetical protein
MKMIIRKRMLGFIAFYLVAQHLSAQTLTASVLSAGGSISAAGGVQVQSTFGQGLTPVALSGGGGNNAVVLTGGFQQPELQVWTGNVGKFLYPNTTIAVPFVASGIISNNNLFIAELSDRNGNFNAPVVIGTSTGNQNGQVNARIPSNTVAGTLYRIRVRSTLSPFIGIDNGTPLTVQGRYVKPNNKLEYGDPKVKDAVFGFTAYPNPSRTQFSVRLESSDRSATISLRVLDVSGRTVRVIPNLAAGETVQLGSEYRPGIYFVEMVQGSNRTQIRLVKDKD